jgi:hypothetical protein
VSKDLFKAFGISDFPKVIYNALGGGQAVVAATLTKITPGTRTNITGGTNPTSVAYTTRGFIDFQNQRFQAGTLADNGQLVIVLLGSPLPAGIFPAPGDQITIESVVYHIPDDGEVDRDPASATYTVEVRKL